MNDERPNPESFLAESRQEKRGKLKIFLGAAPGVGKTYENAHRGAQRKWPMVWTWPSVCVETHGRRETLAMIEGLEVLPRKEVPYKGRVLEEMGHRRHPSRASPALVLVDELAHTPMRKAPGIPSAIRMWKSCWPRGIDVYSTLNIQAHRKP